MDKYINYSLIFLTCVIFIIYIITKTTNINKFLGRPLWHEQVHIIDYQLYGPSTSRQIIDIYSFTHIPHGIILYFLFP